MSTPFTPESSWKRKRAQTSVEYIFFVVTLALTILLLGAAFRKKLTEVFQGRFQNYIEQQFFSPGSLHQFRVNISR